MKRDDAHITQQLEAWSGGDREALEQLVPLLYSELHRLSQKMLRSERSHHTLQATALVNEAYLRLKGQHSRQWVSRSHFFSVAARLMRQILVDHARRRQAAKRAGGARRVTLTNPAIQGELASHATQSVDLLILEECLTRLAEIDPVKVRMVELRFFVGLDTAEIAEALRLAPHTVRRGLNFALSWLSNQCCTTVKMSP